MKLSPNFTLAEMTVTSTGLPNQPANDQHLANLRRLAEFMQEVRALFNVPITITSAYRSPAVNRAVGGVPTSHHALGRAADFRVSGVAGDEVARRIAASPLNFDQLIFYRLSGVCHISIAPAMRRQVRTNPTNRAGARLLVGVKP
jgi:putative chitinase